MVDRGLKTEDRKARTRPWPGGTGDQMRTMLIVAVIVATWAGALRAQVPSPVVKRDPGYSVPRTPWGDPDLQGKWPSTDMVGTPMQRDSKLGTRNVLTEAEYKQVQERFVRQAAQDRADFDLEHAAATPGGDVGGPVSPPPHWLERGKAQYQASLIVHPADGRMPALTPQAQQRQAAARETRQGRGPADSYTDRSLYAHKANTITIISLDIASAAIHR